VGNALVTMNSKYNNLEDACNVFDKIPERNVVSWTAMIAGYTENGHGQEPLKLFSQMLQTGLKENQFTYENVLRPCASLATVEHGKQVHTCIIKSGFEEDLYVDNALITMYTQNVSIRSAWKVSDRMTE
jgi:pentatricopeptide repeat protein